MNNTIHHAGIIGDGTHDDTAGIQALLDAGTSAVYLPPPPKQYLISRTLIIHSGQTLRLDNLTTIRLAPGADTIMLTNDDHTGGNDAITLMGGVWDMDNRSQSPNPFHGGDHFAPYSPERYIGVLMRLVNVRNLTIRGLTLRDPITFGIQLAQLENFTIEDITFDYTHCNPIFINMDGVHIHGPSRFGRIANLKGATHDDMVALNADDGHAAAISSGPIEDISIDGLYADNGYTGVRLLSMKSPVRRIRITNVFGSFRVNAIAFSNFRMFMDFWPGGESRFEDISLTGLCIRKTFRNPDGAHVDPRSVNPDFAKESLVWIESGAHIGNLSVTDFQRTEEEWAAPSIAIERGASVDSLHMTHVTAVNRTAEPLHLLTNDGHIGQLASFGTSLKADAGRPRGKLLYDTGTIGDCCQYGACSEGTEHKPVYRRGGLPAELAGLPSEVVLDFPVGYKGYAWQLPAKLEEDDETDSGYILALHEQNSPCPVYVRGEDRERNAGHDNGVGYAWHFLGDAQCDFDGTTVLGFGDASDNRRGPAASAMVFNPKRCFVSPSLQPGIYGLWILAKSDHAGNGCYAFRLSRVVLSRCERRLGPQ